MATRIDLSKYEGGYWGYLNDDVKYTISSITSSMSTGGHPKQVLHIEDPGGIEVMGDIVAIGTFAAISMIDATDDSDAASKGVSVDDFYHTAGTVKIRLA